MSENSKNTHKKFYLLYYITNSIKCKGLFLKWLKKILKGCF